MWRVLLYLWPLPVTLVGALVALLARASGGHWRVVDGVLEAAEGWPQRVLRRGFPFVGAVAALTLGHVVVAISGEALAATRAHERAHVRQFERWGVLMVILYPLAGIVACLRGGHFYRDNCFEREAREAERAVFAGSGRRGPKR